MRATRWLGVVARLVTGGVWLAAGFIKLADPAENVRAVRAYDLLPESVVPVLGHTLPILEIVVGLCLVVGLVTRWAAVVSALMLLAFIIGISAAWARGMSIECGCFGGGGGPAEGASDKYPWELARDVGLLLLSAYLIWRRGPRSRWTTTRCRRLRHRRGRPRQLLRGQAAVGAPSARAPRSRQQRSVGGRPRRSSASATAW